MRKIHAQAERKRADQKKAKQNSRELSASGPSRGVLSAITDRRTDNTLESLYKVQVDLYATSLHSRDDIRRQEIRLLQIEVDGPTTS